MTELSPVRTALPDWPRLMRAGQAADYLSVSVSTLERHGPSPKKIGTRSLWDRHDLDRWADGLNGQPLDPVQSASHSEDVQRAWFEARERRRKGQPDAL